MNNYPIEGTHLRTSRIPEFKSREEEAEWWDTHDITDYLDELEPVKVHFAQDLSEQRLSKKLEVRFDERTDNELERRAREQGVKKSTLVRMWVMERLRQDTDRQAS